MASSVIVGQAHKRRLMRPVGSLKGYIGGCCRNAEPGAGKLTDGLAGSVNASTGAGFDADNKLNPTQLPTDKQAEHHKYDPS
ncbi:hypothetical protein RRF57_009089 [Xylaria bambusicola]|uniref:Uncharacterized protein n=1 Tax=Xylaria bambusicola TaxID=326684 RepID=A0AAN7UIZ4_9PEZI